jgi:hypothetical protein
LKEAGKTAAKLSQFFCAVYKDYEVKFASMEAEFSVEGLCSLLRQLMLFWMKLVMCGYNCAYFSIFCRKKPLKDDFLFLMTIAIYSSISC